MGRFEEQTQRIWRKRWTLDDPHSTLTIKVPKTGTQNAANPLRPAANVEAVEASFPNINAGWDMTGIEHDGYRTSNKRHGRAIIRKDAGFSMPARDLNGDREALTYANMLWLVGRPGIKAFVDGVPVDITLVQDDPRANCLVVEYDKANQVPGK
jgi:hypothetical protein